MKNIIYTTVWITLAVLLVFYSFEVPVQSYYLVRNLLYLLMPLYAIFAAVVMLRTYGVKGERGLEYILLFLGTLSIGIGEFVWVYYDQILAIDPFPSVADVFYVLSYPLFLMAIYCEMRNSHFHVSQLTGVQRIAWLSAVIPLSLFVLQVGIIEAYDPMANAFANSVSIMYGIGDLFILAAAFLTFFLVRRYKGGLFSRFWMYVAASFVCMLAADVLFARFQINYAANNFLLLGVTDAMWTFHSFLLTMAYLQMVFFQSKIRKVKP